MYKNAKKKNDDIVLKLSDSDLNKSLSFFVESLYIFSQNFDIKNP